MIRQSQLLRNAHPRQTAAAVARSWAPPNLRPSRGITQLSRIQTFSRYNPHHTSSYSLTCNNHPPLKIPGVLSSVLRHRQFSASPKSSAISFRDLKGEAKSKEETREKVESSGKEKPKSAQQDVDPAEAAYQQARQESEKEWAKFREQARRQKEQDNTKAEDEPGSEGQGEQKQKTQNEPPPPPHDSRSPWQVFTDTLTSEFKASKEWNEGTKALSSSAHQFTESESVKRARAAYTAASGAATSSTASALRGAGKTLGQGAAWTWDTTVVKGVREGVNATGRAIDSATKPVRETKAFKSVKDVIDDGSSSRYGGWVEKEERRKQRELRDLEEAATTGRPSRRVEKMEEDPKCVDSFFPCLRGGAC